MKNLKDPRTKVLPSTTRGGKELPSSCALDSPSVMSKFATPPPARNLDMSLVLDDDRDATAIDDAYDATMPDTARDAMPDTARDAMPDTARDAMPDTALPDDARDAILPDDAMLDTARDTTLPDMPLGVFLDAHIARVTANARDASETADTIEIEPAFAPARSSSPRYELPDIPEGYVMEGEIAEDFLACKDAYDAEKLLLKWKEKSREARMKNDPKFATSPIFVTDKDYEFSVDPEIISLVESDPFHGYESETVIAHLAKLSEIANLFTNEEKIRHYYILKLFPLWSITSVRNISLPIRSKLPCRKYTTLLNSKKRVFHKLGGGSSSYRMLCLITLLRRTRYLISSITDLPMPLETT